MLPKAGVFAPKDEKAFVKGVSAYMQGNYLAAVQRFEESMARDTGQAHIAEEYFAAFSLVNLGRTDEAISLLEDVLASPVALPDAMMQKYGIGGYAAIRITPQVEAAVPYGSLSAALLLAELYQQGGEESRAAEILESLGALAPDPLFALSVADLYEHLERWNDLVRVTEDFTRNEDDISCQVLVYRAKGLRQAGLLDAALEVLKEALRSKKREQEILDQARYERALTYEAMGKRGMARKEHERLLASNPRYADVKDRVQALESVPRAASPRRKA